MSPFQLGLAIGCVLGLNIAIVLPFLARELRNRRTVRALTAEKREDQNRRLRLVLGGAVSTPRPFKALKTKGIA